MGDETIIKEPLGELDRAGTLPEAAEGVLAAYRAVLSGGDRMQLGFAIAGLARALNGTPQAEHKGVQPAHHRAEAALLGKRVRVTLDENMIVEGQLLGFGDGGDFEIREDDGFVRYCWPMLKLEEASAPSAVTVTEPAPVFQPGLMPGEEIARLAPEPAISQPAERDPEPPGEYTPKLLGTGKNSIILPLENPRSDRDFADYDMTDARQIRRGLSWDQEKGL